MKHKNAFFASARYILLIILALKAFDGKAQNDKGIHFVHGLSWSQIQKEAKRQNKAIFVDCYATWCGPCKWMAANIFTLKEVGDYINEHFISVAVQMDQTIKDSKEIRERYGDSKYINQQYSIELYPTYLFFSPDGQVLHRIVGGVKDGAEFIDKSKDAFLIEKQYYSGIRNFREHKHDSSLLRLDLINALKVGDKNNASLIGAMYIECLSDPYSKDNVGLIKDITFSTDDVGFHILMADPVRASRGLGEETFIEQKLSIIVADKLLDSVFAKPEIVADWFKIKTYLETQNPALLKNGQLIARADLYLRRRIIKHFVSPLFPTNIPDANWTEIDAKINRKVKNIDLSKDIAREKVDYFKYRGNIPEFEKAFTNYVNTYFEKLNNRERNFLAWFDAFEFSTNVEILSLGLKLSKRSVIEDNDIQPEYLDTYANLLYKLGDKSNAIIWEKKALLMADSSSNSEFQANLNKMMKDEKTWP